MLFNSLPFALFLPAVFTVYWMLGPRRVRLQNLALLVASYIFYGWWDYRFLALVAFSSAVDYAVGLSLARSSVPKRRRILLAISLAVNLGLLGFFKYFNFFADSFAELLASFGLHATPTTLNIVLPVGISFYTFQTLSYTIDVYRGRMRATRDVLAFFAYVSFFPQLVAGPIERAAHLLPQFETKRRFDPGFATDGLRQILWGLTKKVVVADNLSGVVDLAFANHTSLPGLTLFAAVVLFGIQIYCDFSGYSDIAIGTARLFGFDLMRNFAFPYFSKSIGEFWQRWHISLSTWFRDYLYIPLGGSRVPGLRHVANILITFVVSGLWHGANWTFVAWGLLHGLYYIPSVVLGRRLQRRSGTDDTRPPRRLPPAVGVALTLFFVMMAWVFFRSQSLAQAWGILERIAVHPFDGASDGASVLGWKRLLAAFLYVAPLFLMEWVQRGKQHAMDLTSARADVRWAVYLALGLGILVFGNFDQVEFIYFQF